MAKNKRRLGSGAICEYGTVDAFLRALSEQSAAEVFLAPVYRSLNTAIHAGVLLSGQRPGESSCIHCCVVLAAKAILVGEQGRITYPYRQSQQNRQVRQTVSVLQQELLTVLASALQHDARVARFRSPASYQVDAIRTWNPEALAGFPVAYQDGHWTAW